MAVLRHPDVVSAYLEPNNAVARNQRPDCALWRDRSLCAACRSASMRGRCPCSAPTVPANPPRCGDLGLAKAGGRRNCLRRQVDRRLGPEAIVRLGISHVPEGRRIFSGLTVKENIMLGASNRRIADPTCRAKPMPCSTCFRTSGHFPMRSAGPCRAATADGCGGARLMAKPRLLLLERAFVRTAPVIVQALFRIISEIRRNTTVLLVEQNARWAFGRRSMATS